MSDHIETVALHAGQENPDPDDRGPGSPHLSDYLVCIS